MVPGSQLIAIVTVSFCIAAAQAQQNSTSQAPVPAVAGLRADTRGTQAGPSKTTANEVSPEMRGDIFMARKMYREAIDAYKEAPVTAVTVNKTGIAYHQMMEFDSAKKFYEKSVKLNPHYAEAHNNLGAVYYAKKSFRRAVTQYKKALKYNPDSASIYSNLGTAQFARKQYADAMTNYEKALSLDPEVFERKSTAGVLLQERTVEERAKFHYYQAKLYAKNGMTDRALLCLRRAFEEGLVKEQRDRVKEDPEFNAMRELPEFKELMAYQPRVL